MNPWWWKSWQPENQVLGQLNTCTMRRPISSSGSWWEGPVWSAWKGWSDEVGWGEGWKKSFKGRKLVMNAVYSFIERVETVGLWMFRCLLWSWVLFFYFGILLVLIIDIFIDVHSNHCTCDRWWLFSLQLLRSFLFWEGLISSDLCSLWQISMASQLGITFKLPLFWISLNLPQIMFMGHTNV